MQKLRMSLVPPLECLHADTCLPDYWCGHHKAHISIAVYPGMSLKDIKQSLHSELNQGAVCGSDDRTRDDSGDVGDVWFKRAHAAVNKMTPSIKGKRRFFTDLEHAEDESESVYAYFLFEDA